MAVPFHTPASIAPVEVLTVKAELAPNAPPLLNWICLSEPAGDPVLTSAGTAFAKEVALVFRINSPVPEVPRLFKAVRAETSAVVDCSGRGERYEIRLRTYVQVNVRHSVFQDVFYKPLVLSTDDLFLPVP